MKYLEKEELAVFLKAAKQHGLDQDHELFTLLAYSGLMRAGELCALKWKDIDFEECSISITKTYYNPTNRTTDYQLLTPKTKTSIRTIEIDAKVIEDLDKLRTQQNIIKMKHRDIYHDADFIFVNLERNHGYPLLIKRLENRMHRLLKLSGLNTALTPHSLRHTHTQSRPGRDHEAPGTQG